MDSATSTHKRARNGVVFALCVLVWFILDRVTKVIAELAFTHPGRGEVSIDHFIRFDLVHNTGAAWGSFSDATSLLALFTTLLCVIILAFALYEAKQASCIEMVALALIFAGGLGNLFDRVVYGYVVDMITPIFISFPTFNVADVGVTCGVVLFAGVVLYQIVTARNHPSE